MEQISVTLSANAGVCVGFGDTCIWVDALHRQKAPGFSALSDDLLAQMAAHPAFQNPSAICYTHCHGDHFSRELTEQAARRWPQARILMPEPGIHTLGDIRLSFLPLPHEGSRYASVPHCGLLLSGGGRNLLIAGDCATGSDALSRALGDTPVHGAVFPFPWLTLKKGREMLKDRFSGAVLLFYHLPFAEDDENGYRAAARRARLQLPDRDIRLLTEPLQTQRF